MEKEEKKKKKKNSPAQETQERVFQKSQAGHHKWLQSHHSSILAQPAITTTQLWPSAHNKN